MKLLTTTSILAALALVGVIVLTAVNKAVPQELWGVLAILVGGHLGLTTPATSTSPVASSTVTAVPGPQPIPGA